MYYAAGLGCAASDPAFANLQVCPDRHFAKVGMTMPYGTLLGFPSWF